MERHRLGADRAVTASRGFLVLAIAPLILAIIFALGLRSAAAQAPGIMAPGDAVVTGFPGTVPPPPPVVGDPLDETFINPDGASLRILRLQPTGPAAGQLIPSPTVFQAPSRTVGEIFPITFDDWPNPNLFVGASSAFGIQIVAPDSDGDGRPERITKGQPGATFMEGQWGQGGSPGSIYRIDGITGAITLFTTIGANSGPGLGDIVFDRSSRQFFVSDLDTGHIYRLDAAGTITDTFDHGVNGRPTARPGACPRRWRGDEHRQPGVEFDRSIDLGHRAGGAPRAGPGRLRRPPLLRRRCRSADMVRRYQSRRHLRQ